MTSPLDYNWITCVQNARHHEHSRKVQYSRRQRLQRDGSVQNVTDLPLAKKQ